jgi:hypothetical protein
MKIEVFDESTIAINGVRYVKEKVTDKSETLLDFKQFELKYDPDDDALDLLYKNKLILCLNPNGTFSRFFLDPIDLRNGFKSNELRKIKEE